MSTLAATTAPIAATYGDSLVGLIPVAVVVLPIFAAGYVVKCWLFPFTTCRHRTRNSWRCRRCEGTGRRIRAGRRLINHLRATRQR